MYMYASTWHVSEFAHPVNYTRIDEILIQRHISVDVFMREFERQLIHYLGFEIQIDANVN
jgi:hypothetical protein